MTEAIEPHATLCVRRLVWPAMEMSVVRGESAPGGTAVSALSSRVKLLSVAGRLTAEDMPDDTGDSRAGSGAGLAAGTASFATRGGAAALRARIMQPAATVISSTAQTMAGSHGCALARVLDRSGCAGPKRRCMAHSLDSIAAPSPRA